MRLDEHDDAGRAAALAATAYGLHLDGLAGRVLSALYAREIRAILVKGPVIARWLYRGGDVREYGDVDVLVDPARLRDARRVIERLDEAESVDLHESIPGIGEHPLRAFRLLYASTVPDRIGGVDARVPDETARTVHIALHAGWHGPPEPKPLRDLDLAIELVPPATWRAAAELAGALHSLPGFVTGLEQTERGRRLRSELELPRLETMRARIGFGGASVPAKRLAELDLAHGWRAKAHVVRMIAMPSEFEMKRRYPEPGAVEHRRATAHARRLWRRLAELPAAIRLLRDARKERQ